MPEASSRRLLRNGDYYVHGASTSQRHPGKMGDNKVPSPDQKSFHTSATPTHRGQKRRSPGSIPFTTVWKPQPLSLLLSGLGLLKPAPPGEDKVPYPDQKYFNISTTPNTPGTKAVTPRVDTVSYGVETATSLADC